MRPAGTKATREILVASMIPSMAAIQGKPLSLGSGDDALASLLTVAKSLRKQWPVVVAFLLLGAGLSLVYTKTLPRIYQSQATLEIDPSAHRPLGDKMNSVMPLGAEDYWGNQEYYETQYRIITSSPVLERAARDLGLVNDFAFFGLNGPRHSRLPCSRRCNCFGVASA